MKEKVKVYQLGRGTGDNIRVIDKITLVVHAIDERTKKVAFVASPSVIDFQGAPDKKETYTGTPTTKQRIGIEHIEETIEATLTLNGEPLKMEVGGTIYTISVDSIDREREKGKGYVFCVFVVSW